MPFAFIPRRTSASELIPWTVAFTEGFSTLAVEVIAIRLAVPVVGSSVVLTGVMLGIVLLALSTGYWRGGALSARWDSIQTRRALARNLLVAAALYAVAFPLEARLLDNSLEYVDLASGIGITASLLFLAPIYLASQTVPMLAELINADGKAGRASGKVLFFSTMGSVAGGILTPVYFFPRLGVNRTTYVVCAVLALAGVVMGGFGRKGVLRSAAIAGTGLVAMVCAHAMTAPEGDLFAFDSAYQSIRIREDKAANGRTVRLFLMDGSRSSGLHTDTGEPSLLYVPHVERALAEAAPKTVLVIGAAGFNVPRDVARMDTVARIDAVDIDPSVKEIAERHFLRETLSPKIRFLPLSGRYAVRKFRRAGTRYGFTLVDAYLGKSIPEELVTMEFFQDLRSISDHTVLNAGMDRALRSSFARNLLASFRDAFGEVWWKDVKPGEEGELTNVLVHSWPAAGTARWNGEGRPYRDDRNTSDHDRVELMWAP